MLAFVIYPADALAEIVGRFAFRAWLRLDRSPCWLVPGVALCLAGAAVILAGAQSARAA